MSLCIGSAPIGGVYSTDATIRSETIALLGKLELHGIALGNWTEIEQLVAQQEVAVFVFHLDCRDEQPRARPDEQLERLLAYIPRLQQRHRAAQIILTTSGAFTLEHSCSAAANGVCAIVPCESDDFAYRLSEHIRNVHQHYLKEKQQALEANLEKDRNGLVGKSAALKKVIEQARRAATVSDVPVIIYGESGTGKQKIAELIHQWDAKRNGHPFVSVNCAAIVGSLAESELFGHTKGAFTGATADRLGYFRAANHGTILLDEISELSRSLQPKILRVLQEGLVMPVGSDKEYVVDVRVLAATNRSLDKMIETGMFRLDLLQRLSVIELNVPALRQRSEDIPELFLAFLTRYAHYSSQEIHSVDPEVYQVLAGAIGRGNVRELENLVRQILVFKEEGDRIEITDLPPRILQNNFGPGLSHEGPSIPDDLIEALLTGRKHLQAAIDEYEREMLKGLVGRGIKQNVLADRLGITRRTLYNKLQKHQLH